MPHLLLTDPDSDAAVLYDLDELGIGPKRIRSEFEHVAHGGDPMFSHFYVLDPAINDGKPTPCRVESKQAAFDEDDYASVHVTIWAVQPEPVTRDAIKVHEFTYSIDGRS